MTVLKLYGSDDEQIQALKHWWHNNAKYVAASVISGVILGLTYLQWQNHSRHTSELNAIKLTQYLSHAHTIKPPHLSGSNGAIATFFYATENLKTIPKPTIEALKPYINSKTPAISHHATYLTALAYLNMQQVEKAKNLLSSLQQTAYAPLVHEKLGDIAQNLHSTSEAKKHYKKALTFQTSPLIQRNILTKLILTSNKSS